MVDEKNFHFKNVLNLRPGDGVIHYATGGFTSDYAVHSAAGVLLRRNLLLISTCCVKVSENL